MTQTKWPPPNPERFINYRTGDGGRRAPNKRVVIGRYGRISVEQARRQAHKVLGEVASGGDPAGERAQARAMPTLQQAFEDYMKANPNLAPATIEIYCTDFRLRLASLPTRPLDSITRRDVEELFNRISEECGWSLTNRSVKLLRSIYRRFCIDIEGLRNSVDLWFAGGGKYHPKRRRRISSPAEVPTPAARDALWFGLYTGMRVGEVLTLRWNGSTWRSASSGSTRPRPGFRLNCRSAGPAARSFGSTVCATASSRLPSAIFSCRCR